MLRIALALLQSFPGGQQVLPSGAQIRDLEMADLNGDGKIDAVAAAGKIAVFLGNGAGFGAASLFDASSAPWALGIGDFDGDSILDVVATGATSPLTSFLSGTGAGTFAASTWFSSGVNAADSLAVADFDLDGKLDFAESSRQGSAMKTFFGTGAGTFFPGPLIPCGTAPVALLARDWNGDGIPDLAFGNQFAETLRVALGNGTGGFAPAVVIPLPGRPLSIAAGDVDGDGDLDLAVPTFDTADPETLTVLENAAGSFSVARIAITESSPTVDVRDLNGDGRADLAIVAAFGSAQIFLSGPTPSISLDELPPFPARSGAVGTFLRDVDGDAIPDLVVGAGSAISWFRGTGGGFFESAVAVPTPETTADPSDCIARDFDGDGFPDVALALGDGRVAVYRNAAGALSLVQTPLVDFEPVSIVAGDWNGDGSLDLATGNHQWTDGGNAISALLGTPVGLFGHVIPSSGTVGVAGLCPADMDLDGRLDLVGFHWFFQSGISVWLGAGTGAFTLVGLNPGALGTAQGVVLDVDADGVPDVVAVSESGLLWRRGNGDGTIQGEASIPSAFDPTFVAIADVNADGRTDLVAVEDAAQVLLGNGAGTFTPQSPIAAASGAACATVADVDGDGRADLLTTGGAELAVNPAFSATPTRHPLIGNPSVVRAIDLDLDGRIDAIVPLPTGFSAEPDFLGVVRNLGLAPAHVTPYGTGTPGCRGRVALTTAGAPAISSPGFGLVATNAPPSSLGLALVTDAQDAAGSDPFLLGALLHVDLALATQLLALDFVSHEGSTAFAAAPIPASSFLSGMTFYGQGLFVEPFGQKCTTSVYGLTSSAGVAIRIP